VALVGGIHGGSEANAYRVARELLDYFTAHPQAVPEEVTLWIVPSVNPDGLAQGTRFNAHEVDLNRNADTDLDGCAGNDWQPAIYTTQGVFPTAGGPYPFSEPETQLMRDHLTMMHVVVFYHSQGGMVLAAGCRARSPSVTLAQVLAEATGYKFPPEGWTAYPTTGTIADYLADQGVAVSEVELSNRRDTEFERNLKGVLAVLQAVESIVRTPTVDTELVWLTPADLTALPYPPGVIPHPLSGAVSPAGDLYFIAGGSLCRWPEGVITPPGGAVDDVPVQELLALALLPDRSGLLLLDRSGQVYRFSWEGTWKREPWAELSGVGGYYLTAIAADDEYVYLLDTNHGLVWQYRPGESTRVVLEVPGDRGIGLGADDQALYVLLREYPGQHPSITRYDKGTWRRAWTASTGLDYPLAIAAGSRHLYVVDDGGRRVVALDKETGYIQRVYRFQERRMVISAVWEANRRISEPADLESADGEVLVFAGRDALYIHPAGGVQAEVPDWPESGLGEAIYDPTDLERLRGFISPMGARLAQRENWMPGAPRHYRYGVHQGTDYFLGADGSLVEIGDPVQAAQAGEIIRADHDYVPPTQAQMKAWLARCREAHATPPDVLDHLRGQQVWIDHGQGIITRYAHLAGIPADLQVGDWVEQGQVIGYVGNSGTPGAIRDPQAEVHLHFEIWVGDHYVGQFLSPIETRRWLRRLLRP